MAGSWAPNKIRYIPQQTTQGSTDYAQIVISEQLTDSLLGKTLGGPGYLTLSDAITSIGSDYVTLSVPPGTWDADVTIPANICLRVENGAYLNKAAALTINGPIEAGPYQIFTGAGTVSVARSPVQVEWWGVNAAAFQAAIDALPATGGVVQAFGPAYTLASGLTMGSYKELHFSIATDVTYTGSDDVCIQLTEAADYCIDAAVINPRITASGSGVSKKGIQVYGGLRCRIERPFMTGFTSGVGVEATGNEALSIQDIKTLIMQPESTNCLVGIRFGATGATHWASEFTVIQAHSYWSGANTAAYIGLDVNYGILGTLIECSANSPYIGGGSGSMTQGIGMRIGQNAGAIKVLGGNQEGMYDGTYIHSSANDITIMGPAYYGNANLDINNNISPLTTNGYLITSSTGVEIDHLTPPASGDMILPDYYFIGNSTNGWMSVDMDATWGARLQGWNAARDAVGPVTITGRYGDPASAINLIGTIYFGPNSANGPCGTLTLDNGGGTTTTVSNTSITADSKVFLTPTSANAAAAVGAAAGVWISGLVAGASFEVTHPATPGAGSTFGYIVINGTL